MDQLHLLIPSRGRVGKIRVWKTLFLPQLAKEHRLASVSILIPEEELHEWKKSEMYQTAPREIKFHTVPKGSRLEQVKQLLLEPKFGTYQVLSDDDLAFVRRSRSGSKKVYPCDYKDILALFAQIAELLLHGNLRHGGISNLAVYDRSLANKPTALVENCRVGGFHWYHRPTLKDSGIDYTAAPYHEDIHCTLTLLQQGFENCMIYEYAFEQKTNAVGGCAVYRTVEKQNAGAKQLQRLHPDFVKLKWTSSKLWKGDKLAVRVSWKQAFKRGAKQRSSKNSRYSSREGSDSEHDENSLSADNSDSDYRHRSARRSSSRRKSSRRSSSFDSSENSDSH
jgi:hypothetical protein